MLHKTNTYLITVKYNCNWMPPFLSLKGWLQRHRNDAGPSHHSEYEMQHTNPMFIKLISIYPFVFRNAQSGTFCLIIWTEKTTSETQAQND
jgi:hypothetical protein